MKKKLRLRKKIKQKLLGVVLAAVALASVSIENDATACIMLLPVGLYMILSKTVIID